MTALAGLWDRAGDSAAARLATMLEAQALYGVEAAVQRSMGPTALGRRLHPTTPEDDHDRGPVPGGDTTMLLAADIRIDNRDELAGPLGLSPSRMRVTSDPALLMHVIERWGIEGIARILGPFAMILWDDRSSRLVLARDAMGERPLHYHVAPQAVAVASMPRGLHALAHVPYAANPASAADFLALMPETGSNTVFAGVERVLPGHVVILTPGGTTSQRFWNPRPATLRLKRDADYAEALRELLDRAVARRLRRGQGEMGTHLSAGLDSASVAATAARQLTGHPLFAFTAVPADDVAVPGDTLADEGPLAAATAALYPNIEHVRVAAGRTSPLSLLDRHFHLFERPVLNPTNAVWVEAINDAARARGVSVLLTGQMGNFTISHAGMQRLPQLLAKGRLVALGRLAHRLARRGHRYRASGAAAVGPYLPPAWWRWLTDRFGQSFDRSCYCALRDDAFAAHDVQSRATERGLDLSYRPWADSRAMRLWGLGRVDMGVYNKGVLAGWGIDMRDPTADREVIEFALSVPEEQFILDGEPRSLGRRAFADRLPPGVLAERRRGLQGADWYVGMGAARGAIAEELASLERCASAHALIDVERLQAALADWPQRDWNAPAVADLYTLVMMRGLAAGHFLRKVARTN